MKRLFLFLFLAFVWMVFSACTAEGMYESSRIYNKALKGTPMEQSKDELPDYDQYQKERRGTAEENK
jgi:outer membrane biogenesis lipoprotein LolB